MAPKPIPLITRLERRRSITPDGCWLWTGRIGREGYGHIRTRPTLTASVHRVAFELYVGPVHDGMWVRHLCDSRACFNPDHLYVTPQPAKKPAKVRASATPAITDEKTRERILSGFAVVPGGCWEWQRKIAKSGYGRTYVAGKTIGAHRAVYLVLVGALGAGEVLDHLCRNRSCVNPDHLEPVDDWTNLHRGYGPNGVNRRKTHCKRGHEFTPKNTRWQQRANRPAPSRACRECDRLYAAQRPASKQGAVA